MIELKNVSKVYKNAEETAVKDVSVHIKRGEFFVLDWTFGMWKKYIITNAGWFRRNFFGRFNY